MCMPDAQRSTRKFLADLWVLENEPGSSTRTASALNLWVTSPASLSIAFNHSVLDNWS